MPRTSAAKLIRLYCAMPRSFPSTNSNSSDRAAGVVDGPVAGGIVGTMVGDGKVEVGVGSIDDATPAEEVVLRFGPVVVDVQAVSNSSPATAISDWRDPVTESSYLCGAFDSARPVNAPTLGSRPQWADSEYLGIGLPVRWRHSSQSPSSLASNRCCPRNPDMPVTIINRLPRGLNRTPNVQRSG